MVNTAREGLMRSDSFGSFYAVTIRTPNSYPSYLGIESLYGIFLLETPGLIG
jgi:hypothetical protein